MKKIVKIVLLICWILVNILSFVILVNTESENILFFDGVRIEKISDTTFQNEEEKIDIEIDGIITINFQNNRTKLIYDMEISEITIKNEVETVYSLEAIENLNVTHSDLKYAQFFNDYNHYNSYMDEFPEVLVYGFLGLINTVFGIILIINLFTIDSFKQFLFKLPTILVSLSVVLVVSYLLFKALFSILML